MVCVSFYVICIVELLVSSVICRFQGLSYLHEFSFILFIHHNIHIYFVLCTYCKIWDFYLLQNMNSVKYLLFYMELFCDMFGSVLECYELTHISWSSLTQLFRESCKSEHALLPLCLCNQKHPYVVVVQLLTSLNLHFIMEWLLESYFSYKISLNRHFKHENPLSIYANVEYFQFMSITNLEWFCINCSMI